MIGGRARVSLTEQIAQYLRARPGAWIDGRVLATVGGSYAWRSRVADLRRAPYSLTIDNRQRRCRRADGSSYTVSEYAYIATRAASPSVAAASDQRPPT